MKKMNLSSTSAVGMRTIPLQLKPNWYDGSGALKQPVRISECLKPLTDLTRMPDRDERLRRLFAGK